MSNYPDDMNWRRYDEAQGGNARHAAEVAYVRALLPEFWALHAKLAGTESSDAGFTNAIHDAAETIEGALSAVTKAAS